MDTHFPTQKSTDLLDALTAALEAAPEKERAKLERALGAKVEASRRSLDKGPALTRWLLEAIAEGVDGDPELFTTWSPPPR